MTLPSLNRIQVFGYDGQPLREFTERDVPTLGPYSDGIAALAMGPGGILHVAYRTGTARIRQFDTAGGHLTFVRQFGGETVGAISDLTVLADGTIFTVSGQTGMPYQTVVTKWSSAGASLGRWVVANYVFHAIGTDGTNLYLGGFDIRLTWLIRKYTASFAQVWQKVPAIVIAPGAPHPAMTVPSLEINPATGLLVALHNDQYPALLTSSLMTYQPATGAYGPASSAVSFGGLPRFLAHHAAGGDSYVLINDISVNRIFRSNSALQYQDSFAPTGNGAGCITTGLGMCANEDGLWVADAVQYFTFASGIDELFGFQHIAYTAGAGLGHALSPLYATTWEPAHALAAAGDKPGIKVLPDGRLLAVYESGGSLVARYSRDHGQTWGAS